MNNAHKLFAVAMCCSLFGAAEAKVLDFENAEGTSYCQVDSGASFDGFTLAAYNDTHTGAGVNANDACTGIVPGAHSGNYYALNFNSMVGQLTRDAGTFTLDSLWVHADRRQNTNTTVRFTGLDGIQGNVLYSLDVDIGPSWTQVSFAGWKNVNTLTWDSIAPASSNIAIDDISYDTAAIPEPASLLLLGLGVASLAVSRRRSYQK